MESATTELDDLIADQRRDDTDTIRREFPEQVPFTDGLANCIGMAGDGEIVTNWPRPPRGTLLVGPPDWHGTFGGYTNHACRCDPCTGANAEHQRRRYRMRRYRQQNGS